MNQITKLSILIAAALSFMATTAVAEDGPKLKSGRWMSRTSSHPRPHRFIHCVGHPRDDFLDTSFSTRTRKCSMIELKPTATGYTVDVECLVHYDQAKAHWTGTVTGSFNSEYKAVIDVVYDPQWMASTPPKVVVISKWIGPCNPGENPGDTELDEMNVTAADAVPPLD